jgi:hypothetical protein
MFAIAPAVSMALAAPVGAFSRFLIHAHEHGDEDHVHHGHHHHHAAHHEEHDGHHHNDGAIDDGQHDDQGQHRLHVHYDASCPSVLVPILTADTLEQRSSGWMSLLPVAPMQGAPPDRLLRPPIPLSLL